MEDRYKNPDEMKAMVDSCVKNLYLNGEPNAETIFNKSDDDLSDIEKMMIAIIENNAVLKSLRRPSPMATLPSSPTLILDGYIPPQ